MTEQEQSNRIENEKKSLAAAISDMRRGQWFGAVIALAAIGGAIYLAAIGAAWQASVALVGVPILGIVKSFIDGRSSPANKDGS